MKMKEGFVVRKVGDRYVAVATGQAGDDFQGMIKLNETGKIIWEGIADGKTEEEIVEILAGKFEAKTGEDRAVIADDVRTMIREMNDAGFLMD